jgi:hypothetical protein
MSEKLQTEEKEDKDECPINALEKAGLVVAYRVVLTGNAGPHLEPASLPRHVHHGGRGRRATGRS